MRAWCVDPDEIPVFRRLWVPEPPERRPNLAERRASFRQLLQYPVLIHVGRMRDFSSLELWWRSASSDGDNGQSGLPDSLNHSFPNGEWMVQPWRRGVCDDRGAGRRPGPTDGGEGQSYRQALIGRVGPSEWRIPPMGASAFVRSPAKKMGHGDRLVGTMPNSDSMARTENEVTNLMQAVGVLVASDPLAKGGPEVQDRTEGEALFQAPIAGGLLTSELVEKADLAGQTVVAHSEGEAIVPLSTAGELVESDSMGLVGRIELSAIPPNPGDAEEVG